MRLLVTGATGFVGQNLVKFFKEKGHEVATLGRCQYFSEIDQAVKDARPEVVIHLATFFKAEHLAEDIPALIQSNITFGSQLLEAMVHNGVKKIVNTGTLWQYFDGHRETPSCFYAATKSAFENILQFYSSAAGLQVTTLMLSDTYGANDSRPKLLPKLIQIAGTDQKLEMSPGEQEIAWTHISDILSAFEVAVLRLVEGTEKSAFSKYTVATEEKFSLRQSVAVIESELGKKINVEFGKKPYRQRELMKVEKLDPALPSWAAKISFREGLQGIFNG
jgi:nucleoside-diphosphate-sugar epimerase